MHVRGGVVEAVGDVVQVEDLSLQSGEFGVGGAQHLAVGGGELVARDACVDLEDAGGGGCGAAAIFGVVRQLLECSPGGSAGWPDPRRTAGPASAPPDRR